MSVVIGLTGSIATGKSTVSNMFKEWEIPVVDADQIARDVVEPGEVAYQKIVDHFGELVLHDDKTLNRQKLGQIVFENEAERNKLNRFIHPEIRKEMLRQRDEYVTNDEPAVVLDIPLLFESQLFDYVDKVLVVYVDPELQLERLVERDNSSKEEAMNRINSQISITEKRDQADAVVDNSGTIEESREQLIQILKNWGISIKNL
ncbi:dephospho-CoA kinase [Tenuibacillus multivorans]|uniref:Dephospho-CoA kinase n=1 Tax=Tenuibacillus multivorans TaxID=237069 RepID=A0A1G9ZU44_9BACI|nr:dephospho-CoA kinase [Tenuibacillus multivorans]GEL76834.1 dephospho-CoA kinase [Tenuibacillus multivorans]SDN24243.1 dephospho-CoA kinase [Tenuibacillus multivorans]